MTTRAKLLAINGELTEQIEKLTEQKRHADAEINRLRVINRIKDQAQCIEELRDFAMTRDIIIANDKKMIESRDDRIDLLEKALSALTRSREVDSPALERVAEAARCEEEGYYCCLHGGTPAGEAANERNGFDCPICKEEADAMEAVIEAARCVVEAWSGQIPKSRSSADNSLRAALDALDAGRQGST